MGHTTWSSTAYTARAAELKTKTREEVFTQRTLDPSVNPDRISLRECRDSDAHPASVAIIIGLDTTGSMGQIPHNLVKGELASLMDTLHKAEIDDAAVLFCGVGDHEYDRAPLQVGQFESGDAEMHHWLTKLWIEGGGGSNPGESYALIWYLAAHHTEADCFQKRGEKGFIFTIGDEPTLDKYPGTALDKIFYRDQGAARATFHAHELLAQAQEKYHVFHINPKSWGSRDMGNWQNLLGQNYITCAENEIAGTIAKIVAAHTGVA